MPKKSAEKTMCILPKSADIQRGQLKAGVSLDKLDGSAEEIDSP